MNRKKISLVLVFFLAFFLVGCTQKASDPKVDNWDKYQEQGTITIGFDNTFVPMGFEEKNGQYAGFDIDLAHGNKGIVKPDSNCTLFLVFVPIIDFGITSFLCASYQEKSQKEYKNKADFLSIHRHLLLRLYFENLVSNILCKPEIVSHDYLSHA